MKVLLVLSIIGCSPLRTITAPHNHLIDTLNQKNKNTLGISNALAMTKEFHRKRRRESSAIVFEAPTNVKFPTSEVIRFPDDDGNRISKNHDSDENIDLSGSFTPSKNNNISSSTSGTFANCGVFALNGAASSSSSNSGVFTYPNGTQVVYSKCHAIQTIQTSG